MTDKTVDVGPVHVLNADRTACVEDCPHPDHRPKTAVEVADDLFEKAFGRRPQHGR